jgi:hypothetical protein
MNELKRRIVQAAVLVLSVSLAFSMAPASDREFNQIAQHLETQFRYRTTGGPLLPLASFLAGFTRPAGLRRFKLAVFQDPISPGWKDEKNLGEVVRAALGPAWRMLVRQQSRRTGEQTLIFARPAGDGQELMIVEEHSSDAIVLQVTLDPQQFARYLMRPDEMGREVSRDLDEASR